MSVSTQVSGQPGLCGTSRAYPTKKNKYFVKSVFVVDTGPHFPRLTHVAKADLNGRPVCLRLGAAGVVGVLFLHLTISFFRLNFSFVNFVLYY